jgi:hypothetical protein
MTNSPLIYGILDATAERDTQILMQFIYRKQAIILTIDPAIRLQGRKVQEKGSNLYP